MPVPPGASPQPLAAPAAESSEPPAPQPPALEPLWEQMASHPDGFLALAAQRDGQERLDFSIRYANPAAGVLLGRHEAELIGRGLLAELPDARTSSLPEHLTRVLETGQPEVEEVGLYREGSGRWLRAVAQPHGPGLAVWLTDISRRKREEQEASFLAGASHLLATSLDYESTLEELALRAIPALGDALVLQVADGREPRCFLRTVAAEPAAEALLRELARLYTPRLDGGRSAVGQVLERGESRLMSELTQELLPALAQSAEQLRLVQQLAPRSAMLVPLRARERVLGLLMLLMLGPRRRYGPTDLRLAEDLAVRVALAVDNALLYREAREAVSQRDEFLTVAAHELRTPTTSLKLSAQSLLRTARRAEASALSPQVLARLESIDRNAGRLSALVNELLDVTRLHAGRLRLELEPVDLGQLTCEVVARFEFTAHQAGSPLHVHTAGTALGQWDRLRLEQVVTNLLSNALKYGAGKPVHVRVEALSEHALLVVADEGIGIPPESLPRLFGRFERAVSERHYGGLGLGLYITRQIVESLGGSVGVRSTPGAGATFTVELPYRPPP